jgi:site-specific DNA-methyltransferase (adenine-specific)
MYRTSHDQSTPIARSLAAELRAARLRKKWTQAQLAKKSRLPIRCIQRCESGGGSGEKLMAAFAATGLEIVPAPQPRQHARTIRYEKVWEPTWSTPHHITEAVLEAFERDKFCLDVASPDPPTVPCERFFTEETNGLAQTWQGDLVWGNPPYKPLKPWINKTVSEYKAGKLRCIVLLIPCKVETNGQRQLRDAGAITLVLHTRLKFGGRKGNPEFGSALYVLGATDDEIRRLRKSLPPHDQLVNLT